MKRILGWVLLACVPVVLTACGTAGGTGGAPKPTSPAIAAGTYHSLALKSDGSVWAWGDNFAGNLGDGTTTPRNTPVQVLGPGGSGTLRGVTGIAAGYDHSLALMSDGSVRAWGDNFAGDLGDGTTTQRNTPVQVLGPGGSGTLSGVTAIAAGNPHSLALESDGSVWAWGNNSLGELGDGTIANRLSPVQVVGPGGSGTLSGVTAIAAGLYYSLALKSDGSVWAWGFNSGGNLGDGTTTQRNTPVQVLGPGGSGTLTGVTAIAAGNSHSLALVSDGSVWAWGNNYAGSLGDGTTTSRLSPVQVVGPGGSGTLTGVTAIAAGNSRSLALKSDGSVWAWGDNTYGELGDGTTTQRNTPVQVLGPGGSGTLTGVTAIAARQYHSLALKSDGSVWAWGYNAYGQLGDGTTTERHSPVQVLDLP